MTPAQSKKLFGIVRSILDEMYVLPISNKQDIGKIIIKLEALEAEVKGKE